MRFITLTADQVGIFVGLKVRHTHDDAFWIKRRTQRRDPFRQTTDIEFTRRIETFHHGADFILQLRRLVIKLQQCTRVYANHTVDDKFQTRQTNTFVWQAGEVESAVRVTDVHHHLQRQIRHGLHAGTLHAKVEHVSVNITGVAFGTRDSNLLTIFHALGRIATAHHGWDPQLTGNDCRVTGTTATVGDNRRCFLHDRFPVRVGHVGNQYVAWFDTVHFADVLDDFDRTRANAVTDSTTFSNNFTLRMQRITLHHLATRTHGFRTRLHNEQLAGMTVFRPFDIHRTTVVLLDLHRLLGQFLHFFVSQGENVALFLRHIFDRYLLTVFLGRRVDHADFFRTHGATNDSRTVSRQRRFMHVEFIRVNGPLHDHLAQAPCRGDKHHLIETGFGIDGEHDAGRREVRTHHPLHTRRERYATMVIPLVDTIRDRAVVKQRSKYVFDGNQHGIKSLDVEEGFLLTGK